MAETREALIVKRIPELTALLDLLPPAFRWACESEPGAKYDVSVPAVVAGRIVATDGRVMVWIPAEDHPDLASAVELVREGRLPFPSAKSTAGYMATSHPGPDLPAPDLAGCEPCDYCGGSGVGEFVVCHCCGETTHTPGVPFACGHCRGSGYEAESDVYIGGSLLNPWYLRFLRDAGATFRVPAEGGEKVPVTFRLPDGVEGVLMPMSRAKKPAKAAAAP